MIFILAKRITSWFKPDGYMSRKEAADYLGLSVHTLRLYEKKGLIKSKKFENAGNVSYYDIEEMKNFKKFRTKELDENK